MKEIEVKILEIDKKEIIEKLEILGAKRIFEGNIDSHVFVFDDDRIKKNLSTLRLRKMGAGVELVFKKGISKKDVKIEEETQVNLDNFDLMFKILENVGLKSKINSKKKRISYLLDEVRVEIDTYEDIPTFLEIEAPSVTILNKTIERLGFSLEQAKPWSGRDVFEHYGKIKIGG
tara:strand:- start:503 stop:1027 length:525 start_codon:yes stop_codon:yes gene_type:complete